MFRSVMVPVDGSAFAEHALPSALELVRQTGATLHLVRAHVPPVAPSPDAPLILDRAWLDSLKADERHYLANVAAASMLADVKVETALVEGFAADALAAYARTHGVDLIVMTTHGRGGISRFWLGSVADALVRNSGTPVLLIRPHDVVEGETPTAPPMRHFLIPTDGSPLSYAVLAPALELGEVTGARFTLLRVVLPPPPAPRPWTADRVAMEAKIVEADRRRALAELEAVAEPLRERGLDVACQAVPQANPVTAILEVAAANAVDVIAIGTHGRSGFARIALGSVADKVVRGSMLPVLVLHPTTPGAKRGAEARGQVAGHARA